MVTAVSSAGRELPAAIEPLDRLECALPYLFITISSKTPVLHSKSVTQAPLENTLSYYHSFNPRGFVPAARSDKICQASSGSLCTGNSCFDTRPRRAMSQAYD
jgi:hypothetical protein